MNLVAEDVEIIPVLKAIGIRVKNTTGT